MAGYAELLSERILSLEVVNSYLHYCVGNNLAVLFSQIYYREYKKSYDGDVDQLITLLKNIDHFILYDNNLFIKATLNDVVEKYGDLNDCIPEPRKYNDQGKLIVGIHDHLEFPFDQMGLIRDILNVVLKNGNIYKRVDGDWEYYTNAMELVYKPVELTYQEYRSKNDN